MQSTPNFNKYLSYEFEEFIESDHFRKWVIDPTDEDHIFWDEFFVQFPEKIVVVNEAKEFLLATQNYFKVNDLSKEDLKTGLGKILEKAYDKQTLGKRRFVIPVPYRWAMVAATFVIGLVSGYFYYTSSGLTTYTTDFGEWKSVELPDGSKVDLNANSELILADWSEGVTRQVWLKGEAFFKVAKQQFSNSKFQVITDDLTIEVLGTEFNVQDRGEQTEVYLLEGRIKLDLGITKKDLEPGDFISYSAEKNKEMKRRLIISISQFQIAELREQI